VPAGIDGSAVPAAGAGSPGSGATSAPAVPDSVTGPAAPAPSTATEPSTGDPTELPAAAVWCEDVVATFPAATAGGTVPTGSTTLTGWASPATAGRAVTWSIAAGARAVASGSAVLGPSGSFSAPVTLPVGALTVTTALRLPDGPDSCPARSVTVTAAAPSGTWLSGASGAGVADGTFGTWRGSPTPIAGTWADNNEAQVELWQLWQGFEFGSWQGDLDIAVGAIGPGESWAAAATGAYDARWRQSLTNLARLWAGRPGQLYIRFAHEFNGNWYPWSVTGASVADFRTSWIRYRAIQQQVFPAAQLVFSPNSETSWGSDLDWRQAFPGRQYVDVMAVDYYNMYPFTSTAAQFAATSLAYDRWGAPRGLQRHQEFAASVGLPFAVAEWGNNADFGDSPAFVQAMADFFRANAGTGPGRLRYEIYFNVVWDGNPFALWPSTNAPNASGAYRQAF
jgi:hypothetical protein